MGVMNPAGVDQVKFAHVSAASDGDNDIVTAVAGKRIRVIAYAFTVSAASTVVLQDSANTDLATFILPANGGVSYAGGVQAPAFETAVGTGLEITNAASNDTFGHVTYIEVD